MTECSMASHLPFFEGKDNYVTVGHIVADMEQKVGLFSATVCYFL